MATFLLIDSGGVLITSLQNVNERIRAKKIRLISPDGEQFGIVTIEEALKKAEDYDLDLVEVAPNADPPVCRIMDYSKYKYQQEQKEKDARKKQSQIVIKEIKLRPKIDVHDLDVKKKHIKRFLKDGARVKITVMFKGREMVHTELGKQLLDNIIDEFNGQCVPESEPKLDGKNLTMILIPSSK